MKLFLIPQVFKSQLSWIVFSSLDKISKRIEGLLVWFDVDILGLLQFWTAWLK